MEPTAVNEEEEAPKVYGDYEVVRVIGKGKFAVVYRAKRISDGEIVALKRINVDAIDPVSREKCLKEIRLLQSLDHPNIIKYLDSFISDNDLVIVIEWAAAGDLKRQIRKAQERGVGFDERLIWKYFSQICDAMQHMHEKRIMHRDLKPANIFLTLDGTIKVGDLGLSRELSEHTIQAHSKVGTPLYMSPEVLRGDGYEFKSDIWSLGCLLYELAMLKSPFKSEGLNLYSLFQKISQGDYQPLPDNYSEQLRSLAYSMISTKSEDRPELSTICQIASQMRNLTAKKSADQGSSKAKTEHQVTEKATTENRIPASSEMFAEEKEGRTTAEHAAGSQQSKSTRRSSKSTADEETTNLNREDIANDFVDDRKKPVSKVSRNSDTDAKAGANIMPVANEPPVDFSAKTRRKQPAENISPVTWNDNVVYPDVQPATAPVASGSKAVPYSRPKIMTKSTSEDETKAANNEKKNSRNVVLLPSDEELDIKPFDGKETTSEGIQKASSAFALMEIVFGKLCVLDYPMTSNEGGDASASKRLLPVHFACDLSQLGRIAGYNNSSSSKSRSNNDYFQFRRMTEVSLWLLNACGNVGAEHASRIDISRDAPSTISKLLLGAANAIGVTASELPEIAPTSLLPGFGEKVCLFLLALTDKALAASGKVGKPLIYHENNSSAFGVDGSGVEEVEEEGILESSMDFAEAATRIEDITNESNVDIAMSMVMPTVDPIVWKEELERITPSLVKAATQRSIIGNSWDDHFLKMRNLSSSWTGSESSASHLSVGDVAEMLKLTSRDVHEDLSNVGRGEDMIGRRDVIRSLSGEFSRQKQTADDLTAKTSELSKNVEAVSNQYSALEEKLEECNEQLESKIGGEGKDELGGGVLQFRNAIKSLKAETESMGIQIGLVNAHILQRRLANSNRVVAERKKKKGKLNKFGSKSATDTFDDIDGSLE